MKGSGVIIVLLAIVLVCLIGLQWIVLPDPSRRNYEFLPDMVESVPRPAQSPVPLLADGSRIDLRPPPGSVARGYEPLGYPATPEGALQAGQELWNPLAVDDGDALERGAFVFNTFCSVCHGAGGNGDGTVTRRGVPPPPSLLAAHAREMRDGQMYHAISLGQANMASYASQVRRQDRWRVILYIRSLQQSATVMAEPPSQEAPEQPS